VHLETHISHVFLARLRLQLKSRGFGFLDFTTGKAPRAAPTSALNARSHGLYLACAGAKARLAIVCARKLRTGRDEAEVLVHMRRSRRRPARPLAMTGQLTRTS